MSAKSFLHRRVQALESDFKNIDISYRSLGSIYEKECNDRYQKYVTMQRHVTEMEKRISLMHQELASKDRQIDRLFKEIESLKELWGSNSDG